MERDGNIIIFFGFLWSWPISGNKAEQIYQLTNSLGIWHWIAANPLKCSMASSLLNFYRNVEMNENKRKHKQSARTRRTLVQEQAMTPIVLYRNFAFLWENWRQIKYEQVNWSQVNLSRLFNHPKSIKSVLLIKL